MGQRMKLAQIYIYIYAVGNRRREISWDPYTDPFAFHPRIRGQNRGRGGDTRNHIFPSFLTRRSLIRLVTFLGRQHVGGRRRKK